MRPYILLKFTFLRICDIIPKYLTSLEICRYEKMFHTQKSTRA